MQFSRCMKPRWKSYLVIFLSLFVSGLGAAECSTTVVSLLPSFTETVYSLGFGDCIVGVSDFCRFPEEARTKPRAGGLLNPHLERIVALRPRVVVLSQAHKELEAKLNKLGIETLSVATDDLEDVYAMTEACGQLFGRRDLARQMADGWRACLQGLAQETSGPRRPRTLLVVSRQPGELRDLYVATPRSYLGQLLSYAGGENVACSKLSAYALVSKEEIIGWNPEVIIDLSLGEALGDSAAAQGQAEVWRKLATIDAVRQNQVFMLGDPHLTIPGPAMCETARTLANLLHSASSSVTKKGRKLTPSSLATK